MTDLYTNRFSDNFRLARSKILAAPADATYNLIRIPRFAFVSHVMVYITTAFTDAGASCSVGFIGNGETADPDGFLDTVAVECDATGMKTSLAATGPASRGKWFNAAKGAITLTCDDNGGTAGTMYLFAYYSVIH